MKIVKSLILERKDLRNIYKLKNRKEVATCNFKPELLPKIYKAEIVIFEGVLLISRF